MKRKYLFFALAVLVASCGKDKPDAGRCNTFIADYLYGVEYDDYDFDACKEFFDGQYISSGAGCSEVRKGRFVGRNLDWFINGNAAAVIKVNGKPGVRYASIGIVGCFPQFSNELAKDGGPSDIYRYLPFKTEDGVNEKGLYVGVNVVPTGETSFDKSTWDHGHYGHGAARTNPAAGEAYAVNYLPRILLDRAASVAEAKDIISKINWTDPINYPDKDQTQSFHWLISDAGHSVVLEFIDNKPFYSEAESISSPSFGTIMTNFSNGLWEAHIMQNSGIGYERYDILRDNYDDAPESFDGIAGLMKKVWYSKYYTTSLDTPEQIWMSEFAGVEPFNFSATDLYQQFDVLKDPDVRYYLGLFFGGFKDKVDWYTDDCVYWSSTHTSVYDLSTQTMRVLVHEGMDGMSSFYEASLAGSHFAKPLELLRK